MYFARDLLKDLNSAFIDNRLRKGIGGYALDTSVLVDYILLKRNFSSLEWLFSTKRITIYQPVLNEIGKFLYENSLQKNYKQVYWEFQKLLNRKNVRIVDYHLENGEMLELIKEIGLPEDPELTLLTLKRNLEPHDAEILLATLYENGSLLTRDKRLKEIAKLYKIQTNFPKREIAYQINLKKENKTFP
ncbi:MAG: PIN domain-containing protein [Candidatus Aenigmatarchaeota archaeon]